MTELPSSDPDEPVGFTPEVLDRTVLSIPLLKTLEQERRSGAEPALQAVVIDVNLTYAAGRGKARERVQELVRRAVRERGRDDEGVNTVKSDYSEQYLFARLRGDVLRRLVVLDGSTSSSTVRPGSTTVRRAGSRSGCRQRRWP